MDEENKAEKENQNIESIAVLEPKKEIEKDEEEKNQETKEENTENNIEESNTLNENNVSEIEKKSSESENIVEEVENIEIPKNENQQEKNHKKSKAPIFIIFFLILTVIVIGIFSTIFALKNSKSDKIINGVYIENINISNLTKEEAKEKIMNICSNHISKDIKLLYGESETTINLSSFEVSYNISQIIDQAYEEGRTGNIFEQNYAILKTKKDNVKLKIDSKINEEAIISAIENIIANSEEYVVQPSYYVEKGKLIITRGNEGITVSKDEFLTKIYSALNNIEEEITDMQIPTKSVEPDPINIDQIHTEIYKEVKDAYYTQNPFTIHPEVEGVDFDVEEAKEAIKEVKDEYEITLKITKPSVTTKDIGTEAFPDLLSSFSTKYDASNKDRTTNLQIAVNKINGTVLLPGEEFSYNNTLGERTVAAGYKEAKVFSNGQVVDGIGGGICQISSTLYDAVIFANLKITKRRNHQFVTSYVGAGRDATVVWGAQDFKFVNSRKYPIRISASIKSGVAEVLIYGVKEETEYEISIETKQISTIPYTTKYVNDSSLESGKEKVKQSGANGRVVEAYKVMKLNGKVVSRTLLSKDTYIAKQQIIARGTK